jgi:hypothetical protein
VSAFSDQLGEDFEEALRTAAVPAVPDPFPAPGTPEFAAFMLECQQSSWKAAMEVLEPYLNTLPRTAEIALSASQGSWSVGNRVVWDSIAGALDDDELVSLSSGTVTLVDGHTYHVRVQLRSTFTPPDGGNLFVVRTPGNVALVGDSGVVVDTLAMESDSSIARQDQGTTEFIITADGADVVFDVDMTFNTRTNVVVGGSRIVITEVR